MAGKIPWYLKDGGTDPYKRQRAAIAKLVDGLTTAQREDWYGLVQQNEHWDGEVQIELAALRHFVKVRNS